MASILDLPDDCLIQIFKKLGCLWQVSWRGVCKRFKHIYIRYSYNSMEVNSEMATNYGHLMGTDDFLLRSIKRLYLTESSCTKNFLNKLRECHKEIEEAKLNSFNDEYLKELLPLPNLKKLICFDSYNLRGESLLELNSLTELHIDTDMFFDPENMLQITYYNPLRTLVMLSDPQMFSNRYAFEMFENLKNVERLVIEFNPYKSWQLVGTLPKLKILEIFDFVSDKCETCLEDPNLQQTEQHAEQHATIFFDELRRRNQLEELAFYYGNVSEQHLLRIVELTNLKRLKFFRVDLTEFLLLGVFKDLVNLEELHLLQCDDIYAEPLLELIRCCKKLKVLLLRSVDGVTADFLTEANDILSRRQPTPLEPLTMEFAEEDEHLKLIKFAMPLPFLRFIRIRFSFAGQEEVDLREEDYLVNIYVSNDRDKGFFYPEQADCSRGISNYDYQYLN
ncbi:uncharacterized protein LOC105215602 isoform X1 [Zeugodacus cucurbitae]|uniref:uncharacterized protein LOC105215602 isoform X1 n=1 Tax=Zeugodacus cucurbitae TaxID=28588 RepID=UPI0005969157|nr:uncharacterized protein LOC105215602 isoform X1 [Zeugodacus cucurbitae]